MFKILIVSDLLDNSVDYFLIEVCSIEFDDIDDELQELYNQSWSLDAREPLQQEGPNLKQVYHLLPQY